MVKNNWLLALRGLTAFILADQFKQAFRALANEVEADLGALYFGASRAVGNRKGQRRLVLKMIFLMLLWLVEFWRTGAPTTDLQMVLGSTAIANCAEKTVCTV